MAGHRGYTFGDFILISIVSAIWRAMVFCVAVSWRAYKRSMSIIAGRPLEQCRSLYLTPALSSIGFRSRSPALVRVCA